MKNYINVHVLSNPNGLAKFALYYHQIRLAKNTIGYMFPLDNSIAGYLPDNFAGTLKHELFHLLLLNNIQPTPPWLDEGLAALYEVSVFRGDSVIGIDNWRGKLIRDNWDYIIGNIEYSIIKVLTNYNWKVASQTGEPQIIDQVVINAISRYFFLFLQEKKLLFNYVLSKRNCTPDNQKGYYLTRLEEVTGKPSTVLDSEFNTWLKQKVFSAKY